MSLFVLCLIIAGVVGGAYLFAPRGKRAGHRATPHRAPAGTYNPYPYGANRCTCSDTCRLAPGWSHVDSEPSL